MVKYTVVLIVVLHGSAIIWLTHSAQHRIMEHRLMKHPMTWPDGSILRRDRSISWPTEYVLPK